MRRWWDRYHSHQVMILKPSHIRKLSTVQTDDSRSLRFIPILVALMRLPITATGEWHGVDRDPLCACVEMLPDVGVEPLKAGTYCRHQYIIFRCALLNIWREGQKSNRGPNLTIDQVLKGKYIVHQVQPMYYVLTRVALIYGLEILNSWTDVSAPSPLIPIQ